MAGSTDHDNFDDEAFNIASRALRNAQQDSRDGIAAWNSKLEAAIAHFNEKTREYDQQLEVVRLEKEKEVASLNASTKKQVEQLRVWLEEETQIAHDAVDAEKKKADQDITALRERALLEKKRTLKQFELEMAEWRAKLQLDKQRVMDEHEAELAELKTSHECQLQLSMSEYDAIVLHMETTPKVQLQPTASARATNGGLPLSHEQSDAASLPLSGPEPDHYLAADAFDDINVGERLTSHITKEVYNNASEVIKNAPNSSRPSSQSSKQQKQQSHEQDTPTASVTIRLLVQAVKKDFLAQARSFNLSTPLISSFMRQIESDYVSKWVCSFLWCCVLIALIGWLQHR